MNIRFLGFIFLFLLTPNISFSRPVETIDLSDQFPDQYKIQNGQTCYLNAAIAALEAALNRTRDKGREKIVLDDEAMILQYLNFILSDTTVDTVTRETREFQRTTIMGNFIDAWGANARPVDTGLMSGNQGQILLGFNLYKQGSFSEVLFERTEKILKELSNRGAQALAPEFRWNDVLNERVDRPEIFYQDLVFKIFEDMKRVAVQALSEIKMSEGSFIYKISTLNLRFEKVKTDQFNAFLAGQVGRASRVKDDSILLKTCSSQSQVTQQSIVHAMKNRIPLIVGMERDSIEMGQTLESLKRYPGAGMYHAMVITGLRSMKNSAGQSVPYMIFRDSGVLEKSRVARLPLTESCRILSLAAILEKHESLR